jgi:hypothetical protein
LEINHCEKNHCIKDNSDDVHPFGRELQNTKPIQNEPEKDPIRENEFWWVGGNIFFVGFVVGLVV